MKLENIDRDAARRILQDSDSKESLTFFNSVERYIFKCYAKFVGGSKRLMCHLEDFIQDIHIKVLEVLSLAADGEVEFYSRFRSAVIYYRRDFIKAIRSRNIKTLKKSLMLRDTDNRKSQHYAKLDKMLTPVEGNKDRGFEQVDAKDEVEYHLQIFNDAERDLVYNTYGLGFSCAEYGKMMGLSRQAVHQKRGRCMEQIKACLD